MSKGEKQDNKKSENIADMTFVQAKRLVLDPKKAITIEGKTSVFPLIFLCTALFFIALLSLIAAFNNSTETDFKRSLLILFVVIAILFLAALGIFIAYHVRNAKLKKEVLSMNVTNGMITQVISQGQFKDDGRYDRRSRGQSRRISFTYVYFNGTEKRVEKFTHKYSHNALFFYNGMEIAVAYSQEQSYILRKYTLLDGKINDKETVEEPSGSKRIPSRSQLIPLAGVKRYFRYSIVSFGFFLVVFAIMIVFAYITSKQTSMSFGKSLLNFLPFILVLFLAFCGAAVYFLAVPLCARSKYKKMLQTNIEFTTAKLICPAKTNQSSGGKGFLCVFKNAGGEKQYMKVPRLFVKAMISSGTTNVFVAFNEETRIVLVPKNKFPNT